MKNTTKILGAIGAGTRRMVHTNGVEGYWSGDGREGAESTGTFDCPNRGIGGSRLKERRKG